MTCHDCGHELVVHDCDSVEPCGHCIKETKKEAKDEAYHRGYEDGKLAKKSQIEQFEF